MSAAPPPRSSFEAPSATAVGQERLLLALTPDERRLFLPDLPAASPAGFSSIQTCDPASLSPEAWRQTLLAHRPTVVVSCWATPPLPPDEAASLRYVCHLSGSVKHVVPRDLLAGGLRVTNWGSLISRSVAEHALLLALACLRNLPAWPDVVGKPEAEACALRWGLRTRSLFGRRVGIHGFGRIAQELVRLLAPFQPDLLAFSAGVPDSFLRSHQVRAATSLSELFGHSEVLFECEALTPRTRGTVDDALLRRLPDDAVFVNVGRGAVVDEEALGAHAAAGRLRVGLDVFDREPLPAASSLHRAACAVLSPHIGGPTQDQYRQCGEFALQNLARYLRSEPLEAEISLAAYDYST